MALARSMVKSRFFLIVLVVLILTNSAVTWSKVWDLVTAQKWVVHSQEVRQVLARLEYLAESAQTARRRYERSGDHLYLAQFRDVAKRLHSDVWTLRALTLDNEGQYRRIQRLLPQMQIVRDDLDPKISELLDELKVVAREMDAVEVQLLNDRVRRSEFSARAAYATIAASAALSLLLFGAAWYFTRRELARRLHNEQQLHQAKERLQMVLDNIPQRIFWQDVEQRFVGGNRAFVADTGRASQDEIIGCTVADFQPTELAEKYSRQGAEVIQTGQARIGYEEQFVRPDGSRAWVRTSKIPLFDPEGHVVGLLGSYEDITAHKQFESALRLRNRALEASVHAIAITDCHQDNNVVYVNPAFEAMTGYRADEVMGRNMRLLQRGDRDQPELQHLREAVAARRTDQVLLRNYRRDGTMFWNELRIAPVVGEDAEVTHFVGILQDVTQTKRYQGQLERQAMHDMLTDLPNRALLLDRLRQAVQHARRLDSCVTVVLADLDDFKSVNDSMGHDAGDRLLKMAAERLGRCVRESDTVARLSSDEFVLLLSGAAPASHAEMQRILDAVSQPLELDGRELYVTASLGSSVYPDDGEDADELLQKANTAMYRSKGLGRNMFHAYSAQMSLQHRHKLELLAALRRAVDHQELLLHYQPRVDLGTGRIVGVEALVRWQHPQRGMVSPAEFIPLAEESGLIEPIGSWVLRAACAQARRWHDMGIAPLHMAVNLSARQFRHKGLALEVAAVLESTGLDNGLLELELTESALMNDPQSAARIMRELKAIGVLLSIDDFGTGYSSLSYLQRFPVDNLKIDRSFVRDLPGSSDDAAIARTVIGLGQSLGMRVVAEGVENREQAAFLREQGCHEMQGFYFSRPLSACACQALLLAGTTLDLAVLCY